MLSLADMPDKIHDLCEAADAAAKAHAAPPASILFELSEFEYGYGALANSDICKIATFLTCVLSAAAACPTSGDVQLRLLSVAIKPRLRDCLTEESKLAWRVWEAARMAVHATYPRTFSNAAAMQTMIADYYNFAPATLDAWPAYIDLPFPRAFNVSTKERAEQLHVQEAQLRALMYSILCTDVHALEHCARATQATNDARARALLDSARIRQYVILHSMPSGSSIPHEFDDASTIQDSNVKRARANVTAVHSQAVMHVAFDERETWPTIASSSLSSFSSSLSSFSSVSSGSSIPDCYSVVDDEGTADSVVLEPSLSNHVDLDDDDEEVVHIRTRAASPSRTICSDRNWRFTTSKTKSDARTTTAQVSQTLVSSAASGQPSAEPLLQPRATVSASLAIGVHAHAVSSTSEFRAMTNAATLTSQKRISRVVTTEPATGLKSSLHTAHGTNTTVNTGDAVAEFQLRLSKLISHASSSVSTMSQGSNLQSSLRTTHKASTASTDDAIAEFQMRLNKLMAGAPAAASFLQTQPRPPSPPVAPPLLANTQTRKRVRFAC